MTITTGTTISMMGTGISGAAYVIPAKGGTQCRTRKKTLGSRFRGNDEIVNEAIVNFRSLR